MRTIPRRARATRSRTRSSAETPDRKLVTLSPTRAVSSCVRTKEMGNKRTHSKELVHWEAGGYAEFDPKSKIVVSCGIAASSPAIPST